MKGTLLPAIIESVATRRDKTVKITLGTQELSPSNAAEILSMQNNLVVAYISSKEISQREIDQVESLDPVLQGKTPSQRLRNTLYVAFSQKPEGFKEFDTYYQNKMDKFIEHVKSKLNP